MKKTLLALSVAAVLSPLAVSAQDNETDETMMVTASRTAQQQFDVLAAVEVFDREQIETINPESLADLLNRVAGISTVVNGTAGNNTSMFVRGGNSDHVLVLVDGVRVGSATLGSKNSADIPTDMIERVEVVRGPRAALWGSDAIGGVIQIFTRRLTTGQGSVGTEIGSEGLKKAHVAFGFGNEDHQYTVAAAASESDGFDVLSPDPNGQTDDDGYDRQSLSVSGVSKFSEFYQLAVSAQLDQGTTEFDTGFGGDEQSTDNHMMQLSNHFNFEDGSVVFSLSNSADKNHDNASALFDGASNSVFETERQQINLLGNYALNDNLDLSGGIDWYKEQVTSHNDYADTDRTANAAFLVGRYSVDRFKFEGSVRHDEVGDVDSETTSQIALGYHVTEDILVSLSHGSAFKAPTFNDLFWPSSTFSSGNPTLKSETADNQEFLVRARGVDYSVEVALYQTDYENLIEWVYTADTGKSMPTNVDQAKVKGAEVTLTVDLTDALRNRLTLSHVDAKNSVTGMQLIRRPKFTAFYEFMYQADNYDLSFEVRHQGQRQDTGGELHSYTVANIGLGFAINENLNVRAKVNNLFDTNYIQAAAWPGPEQAAYQGAPVNFSVAVDYRF